MEKTLQPGWSKSAQPRVRSVKYAIRRFPIEPHVNDAGDEVIYNPYSYPLDEVHFSLNPLYDTRLTFPGLRSLKNTRGLSYCIYRLTSPLQPGEERTLRFTVKSKNRGFENNVSNTDVVQNGTFFNNIDDAPVIG